MNSLNLLPEAMRRRIVLRRRLQQWTCVVALSVIVTVSWGSWKYVSLAMVRRDVDTIERTMTPLKSIQDQNTRMQQRLDDLKSRQSLLSELQEAQYPLQVLGQVSRNAEGVSERLQILSVVISPLSNLAHERSQTDTEADVPIRPQTRVSVKGLALDDLAIADFVQGLRQSGVFEDVELKSSQSGNVAGVETREYLVECVF